MGFPRQESWSELPSLFQGIFLTQWSNPRLLLLLTPGYLRKRLWKEANVEKKKVGTFEEWEGWCDGRVLKKKIRPVSNNSPSGKRTIHKSVAFHFYINKKSLSLFCVLISKRSYYATTTGESQDETGQKRSSFHQMEVLQTRGLFPKYLIESRKKQSVSS